MNQYPDFDQKLYEMCIRDSRKAIRETSPWAVMTCYSAYDGVSVTGSSYYMTDILPVSYTHLDL